MSYRKDLREAELAVIRAAENVWALADRRPAVYDPGAPWTVPNEHFEVFHEAIMALRRLRSQLDAAASPYSDHDTSRTASQMMVPHAGSLRRSILVELHRRRHHPIPGATDDQLERALKRAHTSVSAARNFLVNTGWVIDSGERIDTSAGRPAVVWTLAPHASGNLIEAIAIADRVLGPRRGVEAIATEGTTDD